MTPPPVDYAAIIAAAKAAHRFVLEAEADHQADNPGVVYVTIRTSEPIHFGDEVWLAVNGAVSDASPTVPARLYRAVWGSP